MRRTELTYAWEKFHLASEMLRNSKDIASTLADAYAFELENINDEDMPKPFRERISAVLEKFSLPENVQTITGMGHPHQAVQAMSEDEKESLVKEIYQLEKDLRDFAP